MNEPRNRYWNKYKECLFVDRDSGFFLDPSRISFDTNFLDKMAEKLGQAFKEMDSLEKGGIANADENRMVGHYWLRNPELAPTSNIRDEVTHTVKSVKEFAQKIHRGEIKGSTGEKFEFILVVGIGGSALGPQFVSEALRTPNDPMKLFVSDNTDPDGLDLTLRSIPALSKTICIVISKSGGTIESRNGLIGVKKAFESCGLDPAKHLVAITQKESQLDKTATSEKWLSTFPMWDWVGGRTSELSTVGLLPAALQGIDIDQLLNGARSMDAHTRVPELRKNPAAWLALSWYSVTEGKGKRDMVVLPYKDRLLLLSKYLQQLVMESLGKRLDREGKEVEQGLSVFGNKGSTDQHSFVQQLHDGLNNFFVVFVEVLKDHSSSSGEGKFTATKTEVEPGVTSGDYLSAYLFGTRLALTDRERQSVTISVNEVSAFSIGQLIALFERAVGLYASLININAYHQPGVEFLKKAGAAYIQLQKDLLDLFKDTKEKLSVDECVKRLNRQDSPEMVFKILQHLSANDRLVCTKGQSPFDDRYSL